MSINFGWTAVLSRTHSKVAVVLNCWLRVFSPLAEFAVREVLYL